VTGRRAFAVAVVPAGGSGVRLGARTPKQYLSLHGVPLLVHTLRTLARTPCVHGLVIAVPRDRVAATRALLASSRVPRVIAVVPGGVERQESVWEGLQACPPEAEWIVVHDAVRPFVTPDLVEGVLAAARETGAATCGLPVRETVKRARDGLVESTLDREGLWLIQTPQAFRRPLLREAHERARREGYRGTDDAVLVERLGKPVGIVPGSPKNLKVTTREDLRVARLWARG
jgi:2-C-methyl-D-erythritol 4-phosphate cytidylyltransferase